MLLSILTLFIVSYKIFSRESYNVDFQVEQSVSNFMKIIVLYA